MYPFFFVPRIEVFSCHIVFFPTHYYNILSPVDSMNSSSENVKLWKLSKLKLNLRVWSALSNEAISMILSKVDN